MGLHILSETDVYVLFHEFEDVFLFEKEKNVELWRTWLYGDPGAGWIGLVNDWAVIGGHRLLIWKNDVLVSIDDPELAWVSDIRQTGDDEVELLTDPWGEASAIWKFNVVTEQKTKIRDFNDYREKEYTENVTW